MPGEPHRHITKKQYCPQCEHFHNFMMPGIPGGGLCLLYPPTPFIVGMATVEPPVIAKPDMPAQQVPILRSYYPTVGAQDSCSQWSPRGEGEA